MLKFVLNKICLFIKFIDPDSYIAFYLPAFGKPSLLTKIYSYCKHKLIQKEYNKSDTGFHIITAAFLSNKRLAYAVNKKGWYVLLEQPGGTGEPSQCGIRRYRVYPPSTKSKTHVYQFNDLDNDGLGDNKMDIIGLPSLPQLMVHPETGEMLAMENDLDAGQMVTRN